MAQSKVYVPLVVLFLTGCATTSNSLRLGKVKPNERLYVGRLKVEFNRGSAPSLKCEVYVNNDIVPTLKLSRDGYVFYKTDRSEVTFTRLACYHQQSFYYAAWHHYKLPLKAIAKTQEPLEATYFGDVVIDWEIDPNASVAAAELQPLSSDPTRIGHVYDSGELKLKVLSDFELMKRLFNEKVENGGAHGFTLKEHLVETL